MDAAECLAAIAKKVGVDIPSPGVKAEYVTGQIMERLATGGEHAKLCSTMVNQLAVIIECHEAGQDSDETCSVVSDKHDEWHRALFNINDHGNVLPKPPKTS